VGGFALLASVSGAVLAECVAPLASGSQPYSALFVGLLSNLVSNVPATQLVLEAVLVQAGAAARLAVEAGLAGSIGPIGSVANLLALLIVRREGLPLRRIIILQFAVGIVSFLPSMLLH
jgi:Na+/H+ antiporter NhaD/arsenite permease-like protein